jgi:hypothetical protein
VLAQVLGQGFEALGAFLKVEFQQIGQAHGAGVMHRIAKVDGLGMGLVNRLAVDGAAQVLRALLANPLATDETLQDLGHELELSEKNKARSISINQPSGRLILVGLPGTPKAHGTGVSPVPGGHVAILWVGTFGADVDGVGTASRRC